MTVLDSGVLGIGHRLLHSLRQVLERDFGEPATATLQEAGFAAADEVYAAFGRWLESRAGVADPADLAAEHLEGLVSEFFSALGWGSVVVERLGSAGLAVDSGDWAEAQPDANALTPGCHVTAGLLAGFLGRLADRDVAVMELECRTRNDSRCRFLAGSPETLQAVYDAMSAGRDHRDVLTA